MLQRDGLIEKYAQDLKEKCGESVDMKLLTAVTIGCGPVIYKADASKVSGSDIKELNTLKKNFLIKKLGLVDSPKLDEGIAKVMGQYGKSNRNKQRVVVYYLLTKHFKKTSYYK